MPDTRARRRTLSDTVELLWAPHTREVGRTGRSVCDFVSAAIDLAESEGVDAVSMRNIAARLEVRTMAIYSAIPSKQDLIALMVDRAYADTYPNGTAPAVNDWRKGLGDVAEANHNVHLKHRWLLDIAPVRSLMGPHEAHKTELELRVLDGIGLSDIDMERALSLVLTHVAQQARFGSQLLRERRDTGLDDDAWWGEALPGLSRVYDPSQLPVLMRVGTAASVGKKTSKQSGFDFGLERILDGIAALLTQPEND
ncbi:MAG: TetR/AcrR family transcriptional regulator [Rhizobium sp.]|nr:TetR/AcrR family transcriptional regulator [Rhizobium sp.]